MEEYVIRVNRKEVDFYHSFDFANSKALRIWSLNPEAVVDILYKGEVEIEYRKEVWEEASFDYSLC